MLVAAFGHDITLVGIGVFLSGVGSLLTAIWGMRMSAKKGREEARDEMGGDGDEPRPGDDGGDPGGDGVVG